MDNRSHGKQFHAGMHDFTWAKCLLQLGKCGALWGEHEWVVWSVWVAQANPLPPKVWKFTQVMKLLSRGWTLYTRHKNVYKKIGVCIAEVQNTVFVSLVLFFLVLITKPSKPVLKVKFKSKSCAVQFCESCRLLWARDCVSCKLGVTASSRDFGTTELASYYCW